MPATKNLLLVPLGNAIDDLSGAFVYQNVSIGDTLEAPAGTYSPRVVFGELDSFTITAAPVLGAPQNVGAATGTGAGEIDVTWAAPQDQGASPILGYRVQYSLDGTEWVTFGDTGPVFSTVVAELAQGSAYRIRVAARDADGVGPYASPVTATAKTIVVPPPATLDIVVLGDGSFEVQADDSTLTLTVTGSTSHDGIYTIDAGSLAAGPVNLIPAALQSNDTAEPGETLVITPGLWIYDGQTTAPVLSYTANGTNTVDTSTPGAPVLVVGAADAGTTLSVQETATASNGARTVGSNGVDVSAAAGFRTPADLDAKLVVWLDFTDDTQMWQDMTRSAQVTAPGQDVRYVADKSRNANDFDSDLVGTNYTGGPARNAAGITFGKGTHLRAAQALSGLTSDMRVYAVVRTPATNFNLLGLENFNDAGLGMCQGGGAGGAIPHTKCGNPVYMVDGADMSPQPTNRGELRNGTGGQGFAKTAGFHVIGAHNVDLVTAPFSNWAADGNMKPLTNDATVLDFEAGAARHFIITTNTLSAQEILDLHTWLAAQTEA